MSVKEECSSACSTFSASLMDVPKAFLATSLTPRSGTESGEDSDRDAQTTHDTAGCDLAVMIRTGSRHYVSQAPHRGQRDAHVVYS